MEELKRKLQIMHEILACSKQQANFLTSEEEVDLDGLEALIGIKQNLIGALKEIEDQMKLQEQKEDMVSERLTEETKQILNQITELDTQNIKRLQDKMDAVRIEIKDTKEKIKVNKAYQPILGKEKNISKRLDVKDGRV